MVSWLYNSNWSPRELQAIETFAEKPLPKLRRIQDVISQQISIATKRKLSDALWRLQRLDLIVAAAIDKKVFEKGD